MTLFTLGALALSMSSDAKRADGIFRLLFSLMNCARLASVGYPLDLAMLEDVFREGVRRLHPVPQLLSPNGLHVLVFQVFNGYEHVALLQIGGVNAEALGGVVPRVHVDELVKRDAKPAVPEDGLDDLHVSASARLHDDNVMPVQVKPEGCRDLVDDYPVRRPFHGNDRS